MLKKVVVAVGMAVLAQYSMAANVEVWGAVDSYIAVNKTGDTTSVALSSGGVEASHVGIRGTEDLGNGIQVYFALDSAFTLDNGSFASSGANGLFNRQAELGIRGKYGQLSFGRQYTPHFLTFLFYDPTGLSDASSDSGYFMAGPASTCGDNGELVRASNAISYVLPTQFGLTNFFFAALGEQPKANGATSSTSGNIYNYAAKFDRGNFSAMASYLWEHNMKLTFADTDYRYDDHYFNFSMSYDLGYTKPVFQFMKKWAKDVPQEGRLSPANSSDLWLVQVGTSTPAFGGLWMVSGAYLKNQSREKADSYALGTKYNYPLSKRTRIYTGVQAIWNEDNAAYQVEAGPDSSTHFHLDMGNAFGAGNGYATSSDKMGDTAIQYFVGICHQF